MEPLTLSEELSSAWLSSSEGAELDDARILPVYSWSPTTAPAPMDTYDAPE
jgi:hypothetical protein